MPSSGESNRKRETGKSFGMRMWASQSGLQPWKLKLKSLQEEAWKPQTLFKNGADWQPRGGDYLCRRM